MMKKTIQEQKNTEERVELHLRTGLSAADGLTNIEEAVKRAAMWRVPAIAVTDYGCVQAYPEAQIAAKEYGVKVIYGLESDIVDDRKSDAFGEVCRVVLLAKNKAGLKNIYKLVSHCVLPNEGRTFCITRSALSEHRDGLLVGSAGATGEVFQALLRGETQDKVKEVASRYDYLEIHPVCSCSYLIGHFGVESAGDLQRLNVQIAQTAETAGKPLIASADVRFLDPKDEIARRVRLFAREEKDDGASCPLYFRTTKEMLEEFGYLGESKAYAAVVTNPRKIAESIDILDPIPSGRYYPVLEDAESDIERKSISRAESIYGFELPLIMKQRLDWELSAIRRNGFGTIFAIAERLVHRCRENGYSVSSRGNAAASLVSYLIGVTEINPLPPHYICRCCKHSEFNTGIEAGIGPNMSDKSCPVCGNTMCKDGFDIPVETLLGIDGNKLPDIDLNFPSEYLDAAVAHLEEIFGHDHVYSASSANCIKEKIANAYIELYEKAAGRELAKKDKETAVRLLSAVKRQDIREPSGGHFIISKNMEALDFSPVREHFNRIALQFSAYDLNDTLLRVDLLGMYTFDRLHELKNRTGIDPTDIPLNDEDTMALFRTADTEDVPEFGANVTRGILSLVKPDCLQDLIKISGLIHGTGTWHENAELLIKNGTATIKDVAAVRDDIYNTLQKLGMTREDAFNAMEAARIGRLYAGPDSRRDEEYTKRREDCVTMLRAHGVPDWYVDSLKKIRYMFPKAHAAEYALMGYRAAWYKVHFPLEYDAVRSEMQN